MIYPGSCTAMCDAAAEQKLFMTYATSRRIRGRTQGCAPSKFLREIPDKLVNQIQGNVFTSPRNSMFASQDESAYSEYKPGVLVAHKYLVKAWF